MQKLGEKRLILQLATPITELPAGLSAYRLELQNEGRSLVYIYDANRGESADIAHLLDAIEAAGFHFKDLETRQNSLEEIFVNLVRSEKRRDGKECVSKCSSWWLSCPYKQKKKT